MAPTLSSNSFLLTTTSRSRLATRNPKFIVLAAQRSGPSLPFGLGGGRKQVDGSSSDDNENQAEESNDNPFFKLQGLIPDVKSLVPLVKQSSSSGLSFGNARRRKDAGTVFVVGATGQAGIRIAQTLLRQGFTVRAAVPDLAAAQELARIASSYKIISPDESKRLIAVGSTFQDAESIAKVIGNATKVVVTVGPGENGPTSEVTLSDALQVIEASQLAAVDHVAVIYDGNSNGTSNNNNKVLDGISSFFNNLFSRSQPLTVREFLEKVVETNVTYTLIKTRLTEDYSPESSYNVVISPEGSTSTNDYNVARSKIASLVADVFSNTAVAENKVVEVSTNLSAPLKSTAELFSVIPEDGRRKAYAEAIAKVKAEEEAIKASEIAREAAEAAKILEQEVKKLSEQEARAATLAQDAKQKAEAAGTSMESLINKAKKGITDNSTGISWQNLGSQIVNAVQKSSDDIIPKVQIATVRGQAKARNLPAKKAVVKQTTAKPSKSASKSKVAPESTGEKREERKVFGGLFKQEVIYMDD